MYLKQKEDSTAYDTTSKVKISIVSMLEKINREEELRRIHNFIQRIYIKK